MIDSRMHTFLTLCKEMNYRKTAELLHMTQPAVTQQIQFLEQEYNCKLFIYDKRTLSMTNEAKMLRTYAQNVIYREKKVREQMSMYRGRNLSIGATKTIGEFVINPLISAYLKEEDNNIQLEVDNTENLLRMLEDSKLDFALVEGLFNKSRYMSKLFCEEPFVGICKKNHPFSNQEVNFDDLWNEHLFIREEHSGTRDIFEQMLKEHNHTLEDFKKVTSVGNFGLMNSLLKEFDGITFAYRALLQGQSDLCEFKIRGCETIHEFNYVFLDTPYAKEAVSYFDSLR